MTTCYVVVPTYNEYENLRRLADELLDLPVENLRLLVVDDSSPDGTGELAETLTLECPGRVEVLHRPGKQGLGTAYCDGFAKALESGADFIVEMDADFSHPTALVPAMVSALADRDVVVGSRYTRGGGLDPKWPLHRKTLSRAANKYIRFVLGLPIADITTGFAAYRRSALMQLDFASMGSSGFLFQAEIKLNLHRLGLRIQEVPFVFMNRRAGKSKIGPGIMLEALWKVWLLRFSKTHAVRPTAFPAGTLT
jgi:dolichol-phosphate mannosyltransferase